MKNADMDVQRLGADASALPNKIKALKKQKNKRE